MNKREIIDVICADLYDVDDLEQAKLDGHNEGYGDGYKAARDEEDNKIQELRNSLHVYIQEACSHCGYAPHTLEREVRSGAVALEMFSCSRCHVTAYPIVLEVSIMLDDEEVR